MGFRLSFSENDAQIKIERQDITAPELRERIGTQTRILDLLRINPLTTEDIIEALSLPKGKANTILRHLASQNKIVATSDAKWGLTSDRRFTD